MQSKAGHLFLRFLLSLVLLTGLIANTYTPAYAAVRCYVKYDSSGDRDGTSWTNAFSKLQSAIGPTSPCTEVWVARGTYTPTTDTNRAASFVLKSGVKVYGGFAGNETTVSARNITANLTILSGNIGNQGSDTDNSYHVVSGSGADSSALLNGVIIEAGYALGASPNDRGAGFFAAGGSPTLQRVIVRLNTAKYGAGLFINGGSTSILDYMTVQDNRATLDGGGIYVASSSPTIRNGTIKDNTAQYGAGVYSSGSSSLFNYMTFELNEASDDGGGMYDASATGGSVRNSTFSQNSAAVSGGGMYRNGSPTSLINVIFSDNSAAVNGGGLFNAAASDGTLSHVTFILNTAGDWGGGMMNSYSAPLMLNSIIRANDAYQGGGVFNTMSNASLTRSLFKDNTAYLGAGLYNDGSDPLIENVTMDGNKADHTGGAIYNFSSHPVINNATLAGNTAAVSTGGMYSTGSFPTVANSIVYGNSLGEIVDVDVSTTTIQDTIVKGGCPGTAICTNVIDVNPALYPLGNYGGLTQTRPVAKGSPALDAAGTGVVPCAAVDQRGIARPQDGDGDGVAACDMGATEGRRATVVFTSSAAYDGFIRETSEDSSLGGTVNSTAGTIIVGDDAGDRQYRSILLFTTTSLPDKAIIMSARLDVNESSVVGGDPRLTHGNLIVDIRKGSFGTTVTLVPSDFQAPPSLAAAGLINTPLAAGWYRASLTAKGRSYINRTGNTQFRLRFGLGDNDDASSDQVRYFSGNYSDFNLRPKLSVTYYMP